MAKQPTIERSENYGYYSDLLWCAVPLTGMAWYYYGLRPVLLMLAALVTAYLCDCALAPLHGEGYRANEPSSECFAALIVLLMPASVSYGIVIVAVIAAVLGKEAVGGEGHYPFHPAAVGAAIAGVSWPEHVYYYPAPGTQLPIWGEINDNLVQGMNESLRSGGLPSASTMNLLTGNVSAGIGTGGRASGWPHRWKSCSAGTAFRMPSGRIFRSAKRCAGWWTPCCCAEPIKRLQQKIRRWSVSSRRSAIRPTSRWP